MNRTIFTLTEPQVQAIQQHFAAQDGREGIAYLYCGLSVVSSDPWNHAPQEKFLTRSVELISGADVVSSSATHITWDTKTFIKALRRCREESEVLGIVHYHPCGLEAFSMQDDRNEAELVRLARKRNGKDTKLVSLVVLPNGKIFGRTWLNPDRFHRHDLIHVIGQRHFLHYPERGSGQPPAFLNRQSLALGNALTEDLGQLRIGVVGCGATGSATALLLPRLGVRYVALFDQDGTDETNLNRLHFSSRSDAVQKRPKVEVIKRGIDAMDLGVSVQTFRGWINNPASRDALKSCDVIFGSTDDHVGRLLLNRFAYFYSTPVIDMGLAVRVSNDDPPKMQACDGRVTVLQPGTTCLLCREVIDIQRAFAESLQRTDPEEYSRQKAEAYVIGEGNPSPAVVPFTTSVAAMAVEELIHRLQGFRGPEGSADQRLRQFHRGIDRKLGHQPADDCPICRETAYWGRGDMDPFLDANL